MNLNYKEDVKIDEAALDLEWLDQAELAIKYGKEWVALKKKVTILDEKIKVLRSKLINKAWNFPDECLGQGVKPADQKVEAYYRAHKKHIKLKEEWIEAQAELDLVEIAKNEIAFTRKSALENMVKLYVANYFAGPNVPRDLSKLRTRDEDRQEAVNKQVKVKRNK